MFASDQPVAVILRQGPSRHVQMWLWDTDLDKFTPGQWFKQMVKPEGCRIHPSGKYVYLSLADYRHRSRSWSSRSLGSYKVVSKPPYFTALAFVPDLESSEHKSRIEPGCPEVVKRWVGDTRPQNSGCITRFLSVFNPFGPREEGESEWTKKAGDDFELVRRSKPGYILSRERWDYAVVRDGVETQLGRGSQYDVDFRGRLVFWREGKVFAGSWDGDAFIESELIDLNGYAFEEVEAPDWAKRWG